MSRFSGWETGFWVVQWCVWAPRHLGTGVFSAQVPRCLPQVHRYTGTQVHRYTGTQVHRYTGTQVHRYTGTQVHRYTGTQVHRYTGTQVHRYTGTQVHRYTGTQVHRYTGTQVHRYTGTQLKLCGKVPQSQKFQQSPVSTSKKNRFLLIRDFRVCTQRTLIKKTTFLVGKK